MVLRFDVEKEASIGRSHVLPKALRAVELCAPTLLHLRLDGLRLFYFNNSEGLKDFGVKFRVGQT